MDTVLDESLSFHVQIQAVLVESPTEILHLVVILVLSSVYLLFMITNDKFSKWHKPRDKSQIKTEYDSVNRKNLVNICSKLSANFLILTTVYGILLAFVVSDKISFVLTSWNFVIWTSWVLAVIIRSGWILTNLSDLFELKNTLESIRTTLHRTKEFFKQSLFLLVIAIAFLPSFVFLEPPTDEFISSLPWTPGASILSGAFGILGATFVFYVLLKYITRDVSGAVSSYGYPAFIIIIASVSYFNASSPIQPVLISMAGIILSKIPSVFYVVLIFGLPLGLAAFSFVIETIIYKIRNRKKSKNS